jgi:hypothetical protein
MKSLSVSESYAKKIDSMYFRIFRECPMQLVKESREFAEKQIVEKLGLTLVDYLYAYVGRYSDEMPVYQTKNGLQIIFNRDADMYHGRWIPASHWDVCKREGVE